MALDSTLFPDEGGKDIEEVKEDEIEDAVGDGAPEDLYDENIANLPWIGQHVRDAGRMGGHADQRFPRTSNIRVVVVVDTSGVRELPVKLYLCPGAEPPHLQQLRMGLYPVTCQRPITAFTFRVLDDFLLTNK